MDTIFSTTKDSDEELGDAVERGRYDCSRFEVGDYFEDFTREENIYSFKVVAVVFWFADDGELCQHVILYPCEYRGDVKGKAIARNRRKTGSVSEG